MVVRAVTLITAIAASTSGGCATTSPEELVEIVEEARTCQQGDECELAGAGTCTCATPVNANAAERVDEAAADVDCEGAVAECVSHANLRCEEGRCRSDQSP